MAGKWQGEPIRVVKVEVDGKPLLLATDLEMEAELIALIYRYRWQVELFFKWLKSILGCRHLMAESPEGVAIQIYSALIAALMLQLLTGKRPDKRRHPMRSAKNRNIPSFFTAGATSMPNTSERVPKSGISD